MKVTAKEIKRNLQGKWKRLEYIWAWDPHFELVPVSVLEDYVATSKVPEMEFIDYFNDCDDFARYFLAEVRMKKYERRHELSELVPDAIGNVFLLGDGVIIPNHKANIAIDEGWKYYILDMTDRSMRLAEDSDDVRYVDM